MPWLNHVNHDGYVRLRCQRWACTWVGMHLLQSSSAKRAPERVTAHAAGVSAAAVTQSCNCLSTQARIGRLLLRLYGVLPPPAAELLLLMNTATQKTAARPGAPTVSLNDTIRSSKGRVMASDSSVSGRLSFGMSRASSQQNLVSAFGCLKLDRQARVLYMFSSRNEHCMRGDTVQT